MILFVRGLTTTIVEAEQDKYRGLREAELGVACLQTSFVSNMSDELATQTCPYSNRGGRAQASRVSLSEADSTLLTAASECVRGCLLKAVRK